LNTMANSLEAIGRRSKTRGIASLLRPRSRSNRSAVGSSLNGPVHETWTGPFLGGAMAYPYGIHTYRKCATCGITKPLAAFPKVADHLPNAVRGRCLTCEELKGKSKWLSIEPYKRKESNRRSKIKRLYLISMEEYLAILKSQHGTCAICHSADPGGRGSFAVDHCHKTKLIRGLLCHKCNVGLGLYNESPKALRSAAHYLEFYRGINA
jgi:hypothetical protein